MWNCFPIFNPGQTRDIWLKEQIRMLWQTNKVFFFLDLLWLTSHLVAGMCRCTPLSVSTQPHAGYLVSLQGYSSCCLRILHTDIPPWPGWLNLYRFDLCVHSWNQLKLGKKLWEFAPGTGRLTSGELKWDNLRSETTCFYCYLLQLRLLSLTQTHLGNQLEPKSKLKKWVRARAFKNSSNLDPLKI